MILRTAFLLLLIALRLTLAAANSTIIDFSAPTQPFLALERASLRMQDDGVGDKVLVLGGAFPGAVAMEAPVLLPALARLATLALQLPERCPADLRVSLYLKDKDGVWFQCASRNELRPGLAQKLYYDLTLGSPAIAAVGHGAIWDGYHRSHITTVGVQLYTSVAWDGAALIRSLSIEGEAATAPVSGPWIRHLSTTAADQMRAFAPFELSFSLAFPVRNPCDSDDIAIDATFTDPAGKRWTIPAFYDQPHERFLDVQKTEHVAPRGRGMWRVRFTPQSAGTFRWMLRAQGHGTQRATAEHEFTVAPGAAHGFVRVSPTDPRCLETADGKVFFPIGENIHAPFDRLSEKILQVPRTPNRGTYAYDDYFAKMAAHGENTVVVWMSNWWLAIEWNHAWPGFHGLSDFHLGNAWRLDYVLDAAARHGIQIILSIDNHGKYSRFVDGEWGSSPYARDSGGPCDYPPDFFTHKDAFATYAKMLRYIIARWSGHPNLLCFELVSEFDLVEAVKTFEPRLDQALWVKRVCEQFDAIDPYRRPRAIQYSRDYRTIDPAVAKLPGLDLVFANAYRQSGSIVPLMLATGEYARTLGKPLLVVEFGGSWSGTSPIRLRADLHAGMWASAMTVCAGAPMCWWFDIIDRKGFYPEFAALSKFMAGEDRRGRTLVTRELSPRLGDVELPALGAIALVSERDARLWVYDREAAVVLPGPNAPRYARVQLVVPGLPPGSYRIGFWDTRVGHETATVTGECVASGLTVTLPEFAIDCAIKIDPVVR